jgi:hypothetical protein
LLDVDAACRRSALRVIAFLLHRSALGHLPVAGVAGACWLRVQGGGGAWRRAKFIASLGLPLVVLIAMTPRIITIVTRIDPMHFVPETVRRSGLLATTFGDGRTLDIINLLVMLSPMVILSPLLGGLAGRPPGREALVVGALALPFVLVVPLIHPGQGYIRDWDDFASAGVAMSLATAWLAARAQHARRRSLWLATALTLGAATPPLQWLLHSADLDHALARAEAFMNQPPKRTTMERYTTWRYLGTREAATDRLDRSARAYAEAAKAIPSPNLLHQWAMVETRRNNFGGARKLYRRLVERDPRDVFAWWMLAGTSSQLQDWKEAYRAARRVLALDSTHVEARLALEGLERTRPELVRSAP